MDMPSDLYELYPEFGITAEKAQVLEVEAGNVALRFVTLLVDTSKITPEETELFRAISEDINRKTFGYLVSHLKKTMDIRDSIISSVDEALENRNYLTHRFFRTHNFAIHSETGRRSMLEELNGIQKKLDLAHQILSGISLTLFQMAGRTVDQELAERLVGHGKKIDLF